MARLSINQDCGAASSTACSYGSASNKIAIIVVLSTESATARSFIRLNIKQDHSSIISVELNHSIEKSILTSLIEKS